MESRITEKPFCLSCHFHCEIDDEPSIKMRNCMEKQYCVWPAGNEYLKAGVINSLINTHYNFLSSGFIFIDFSRYHIKLFLTDAWIRHLTRSGLRLIVIADKTMEALAAYWHNHSPQIATVIYANDSRLIIAKKIESTFSGRRIDDIRRRRLTPVELSVLNLLLSETSITEIAARLDISAKRAYSIKGSMQKKMGGRLNSIISG
jgi:DNA-binding CsgD family transcriptional regulator